SIHPPPTTELYTLSLHDALPISLLKHSRWCLLKRPRNLSDNQVTKLRELLKYNLKAVRSFLLREEFQRFWEYRSPHYAAKFLDQDRKSTRLNSSHLVISYAVFCL